MAELLRNVEKLSVLVFLVSTMVAMGLTLTPRTMAAPLRDTRLVLLALGLNFLVAPALAWVVTLVIPPDPSHAIGLLLLGGAAGAPFLPKMVAIARGRPAVSAALVVLLTLGTILFIPFALPLMIPGLHADAWSLARPLVLFILVPLAVGMIVKGSASAFAARVAPTLAAIGNAALLLLLALLVVFNFRALLGILGSFVVIAALLYFAGLFFISWILSAMLPEVRGELALATTGRNFGAALAPAASSFHDPKVTTMIFVGAIVCLGLSLLAARWLRDRPHPRSAIPA
jgi:BASS family bile acid:Na+ symporter